MIGLGLIVSGGFFLVGRDSINTDNSWVGVLAVVGACFCWALDNNFTNQVVSLDAGFFAMVKGLVAGLINVLIAIGVHQPFPSLRNLFLIGAVGFFGYGLSLVCFILSLRRIGAARTSAYFSTAPFVGSVLSLILLGEPGSASLIVAGLLMGIGVLHLTERSQQRS